MVQMRGDQHDPLRFVAGSLLFGVGLGGLADGIVLHQVFQWHSIASTRIPRDNLQALQTNQMLDGLFHLATTLILLLGFGLLWRGWEQQARSTGNLHALVGLGAIGWGVFHVFDHLVFHELLDLHDIRQDAEHVALYNWGFFALGIALIGVGWLMIRKRGRIGAPSAEGC